MPAPCAAVRAPSGPSGLVIGHRESGSALALWARPSRQGFRNVARSYGIGWEGSDRCGGIQSVYPAFHNATGSRRPLSSRSRTL